MLVLALSFHTDLHVRTGDPIHTEVPVIWYKRQKAVRAETLHSLPFSEQMSLLLNRP